MSAKKEPIALTGKKIITQEMSGVNDFLRKIERKLGERER